jgi:disulfide bond formation protein DsbB
MEKLVSSLIINGVLISNIIFVVVLFLYFFTSNKNKIGDFIKTNIIYLIFILSATSVFGSLIYSEIMDFPPCVLCWWQRVLLYPQMILSLVAIFRKEKNIVYYLIPMSVLGFLVSLYQSYVQWGGGSLLPCTAEGGECSKLYVYEYGYITIPFMALSIFVYLLFVSLVYKKNA